MSKELIEELRNAASETECPYMSLEARTADRIEELEREIERKMSAAAFILKERDTLQADNARLREALLGLLESVERGVLVGSGMAQDLARDALSATPEQSLARIRNQVREECAVICMEQCSVIEEPHEFERCRDAIRATKEPE